MSCTLTGTSVPGFGNREIKRLGFETAEAVDYLSVEFTDRLTAYVQAKRSISYPTRAGSDLHKVFKQFVAQHRTNNANSAYYLAVSTSSSKKITDDMRSALHAFRYSPAEAFFRDQPKRLTDIIVELRTVVAELISTVGAAISANEILRLVYVKLIDLTKVNVFNRQRCSCFSRKGTRLPRSSGASS
jgi:hypothetical protein